MRGYAGMFLPHPYQLCAVQYLLMLAPFITSMSFVSKAHGTNITLLTPCGSC
jgi:hypothetical protein